MKYYTNLDKIFSLLLLVIHAYTVLKMKQNWKVVTKKKKKRDLI